MYNLALQNVFDDKITKLMAFSFKDRTPTYFSNSAENLIKTQKLLDEIAKNMVEGKFNRNWNSSFCQTKYGKCSFYNFCSQMEEDV
jgi:CRISPR/Cas system-associated exonuclease Cas4 (RecB family)